MYLLLFTCAVVRAVHLALVNSLSVDDCMSTIRRFCARRGIVSTFYLDNAKTFVGVSVFGENAPDWRYIALRSPWWGGWWERFLPPGKLCFSVGIVFSCVCMMLLLLLLLIFCFSIPHFFTRNIQYTSTKLSGIICRLP